MNNRTTEILNFINAKRKLGLPLTRREVALWTLYGKEYEAHEAKTEVTK